MISGKSTKYFSNKQEQLIAKELGWDKVAGSGAAPCTPGDVVGDEWLGECKTHVYSAKSIYFNFDVWSKIKSEAVFKHRRPVLFTDDGLQSLDSTWCVCLSNSIETTDIVKKPLPISVKKNISFDHQNLMADWRVTRRGLADNERTFPLVYEIYWGGDNVLVMPFESFKHLLEEQ